jgi:type I restriction enzyme M protein
MLTSDVKRRIDAARDVLVGVAPNPTTQIEQITFALIYKFMHDMDQSAVKAGGEASFFTGTLKKYSWDKVLDSRLGNHEKLALYAEALEKFTEAKQLPELFRSIFRSAYLPYKSPETLGLFLKEMNHFDYTHPEELGNAYEYLLSIMSSQGDAGQFRTPRHIIDFMVDVLNPSKDDRILDPACGTGGFLISSYKHILEQHDGKNDPKKKEKPLTPDDRKKLMANLEGYDIDPTMVRIAQVNMYLHQFKNPQIFQYDTLTSEERWNDKYDVILANPPFMSPRGGIRPHNKFGIKSNRSEALFVDYIISHLKPKGRAGIVVPEGIIFKNDAAFKDLRKNLLENGLWAVVSLPGGVFQPYSGVKTSIIFMDGERAKSSNKILFINISADGYDLGATKRIIEKNDLPVALDIFKAWESREEISSNISFYVEKTQIIERGDFNLSGEKYRENTNSDSSDWEMVALEEVLEYEQPTKYIVNSVDYDDSFQTPVLTAGKTFILGRTNETDGIYKENLPVIIFDDFTTSTKYVDFPFKVKSSAMKILRAKPEKILPRFAYYAIQNLNFPINEHKRYWISEFSKLKIPLPPLEVQTIIVAELDGYDSIISGAKKIVENWKPQIDVKKDWMRVPLGEVCELVNGRAYNQDELLNQGKYRVLRVGNFFSNSSWYYSDLELPNNKYCEKGDLLYAWSASFGARIWEEEKVIYHYHIWKVVNDELKVSRPFLKVLLEQLTEEFKASGGRGGTMMHLTKSGMEATLVPIPDLNEQETIVNRIDAEQALVDSSKKLIEIFEERIQSTVAKLWDVSEDEN